ncbi:MAG: DUF1080 domain-containing protein [Candidatus Solibacter sp.]|nr:DUF1080 domain-containing protein [Candidatus Solibacter sp.]
MAIIDRRTVLLALASAAAHGQNGGDWIPLFDGKTLDGWKQTDFSDHGTVRVDGGSIILGRGYLTGITWKGDFPKSGYEIRFDAVRMDGSDFFAGITFPVGGSHCTWINGGWGGTIVGLSNLDGYDASENETSTPYDFVKGRWYSFRLLVTTEFIQAWIDNSMVVNADIRGRRVDLRFGEIDLNKPLGFAAYSTAAGLRKIEYRLVPAAGK